MENWIIVKGRVLLDNGCLLVIVREKSGPVLKVDSNTKILIERDEDSPILE